MGDGTVSLILDIQGIATQAHLTHEVKDFEHKKKYLDENTIKETMAGETLLRAELNIECPSSWAPRISPMSIHHSLALKENISLPARSAMGNAVIEHTK